jgi:general stress protein 26
MTPDETDTIDSSTGQQADHAAERSHLWNLIKNIRLAMFTARHANGHLHSRPMTTQNSLIDEDASLWFFMSRRGEPVADLSADPVVNIAYADSGADSYVSVSGTASVVEDAAKKQQLWSAPAAAWFPGGSTDPDLALVRVRITHADYWDVKANKLVQLFQMARAAVTGQAPTGLGEHAVIRM